MAEQLQNPSNTATVRRSTSCDSLAVVCLTVAIKKIETAWLSNCGASSKIPQNAEKESIGREILIYSRFTADLPDPQNCKLAVTVRRRANRAVK